MIFRPPWSELALDDADLLELLQPHAEQAARHQRNAAMEIAEMRAAQKQLAQHQWRPALREHFGTFGNRAELAIAFHYRSPLAFLAFARIRCQQGAGRQVQILNQAKGTDRGLDCRGGSYENARIARRRMSASACQIDRRQFRKRRGPSWPREPDDSRPRSARSGIRRPTPENTT